MRISNEQKVFIIVGSFVLLVMAIVFVIILPTMQSINKINQETYDLKYYLEKKYESISSLRQTTEKVQEIKERVAGYEKYTFAKGEELKLITDLEKIASDNKVSQKIENSNLDQANKEKITMDLSIRGKYKDVLNYLLTIEEYDYFLNTPSIQFNKVSDRNNPESEEEVKMDFSISLYVK